MRGPGREQLFWQITVITVKNRRMLLVFAIELASTLSMIEKPSRLKSKRQPKDSKSPQPTMG